MGRRVALVIANHHYRDPDLRQLAAPANDAEALAAVLGDPEIAGFEVTTLVNEPHHRVGATIGDFYRDRRHDDLALLYFSGHGLKDDAGRLYLAMTDTRRDSLLFTALSAQQLDQAMEGCVSRRLVLILDCCYSGAFPAGRLAKSDPQVHALERFGGRGRTVLTASDATQYSFEGDQLTGSAVQSVFTRHLVAGLRDGTADLDRDGDITLDELYSYVYDRVTEELPQQRPKKQDDVEGRIVIARNVHWTLPVYVHNALASPIATDRLGALDALAHLHRIGNGMVRERVADAIGSLVGDDSRAVSAAAEARLRALSLTPAVDTDRPEPETEAGTEPEPETTTGPEPETEWAEPEDLQPAPEAVQPIPEAIQPIAETVQPAPGPPEKTKQPKPISRVPAAPASAEPDTAAAPAGESISVRATREALRRSFEALEQQKQHTAADQPIPDPSPRPVTASPWLNLALVLQLIAFIAATVAAITDGSTSDNAHKFFVLAWGLVLISLARALAGWAPALAGSTSWQRFRYLAGAAGCAASGFVLALGSFTSVPTRGLTGLLLITYSLATIGVPMAAIQGRICGVLSPRAAAALCGLVVAWWAEGIAEHRLYGVPELLLLGVLTSLQPAGTGRRAGGVPR
ncbi:caspase, EACC1-associated type [Longispora urticae]